MQQAKSKNRTYPLRMPRDWNPPVDAWSSVFPNDIQQVCMCNIGCQHSAEQDISSFMNDLREIAKDAVIADFATGEDHTGKYQTIGILYWFDSEKCADWFESDAFKTFWSTHVQNEEIGLFQEVFNIPMERSETIFSGPIHNHGMSQIRSGITEPIKEHMYWGGMRDRVPLSADNEFEEAGPVKIVEQRGHHIRVQANENLCIIRSGQDWSYTEGDQRSEYLEKIEPTLKKGMIFLRDKGSEVGCYSCRYMRHLDNEEKLEERTFGLAYFRKMSDLEDWAENHPTHLAIFNIFAKIAPKYGLDMQLRLWHEVSVLPAENQFAEYVNCEPGTGLLGALENT